MSVGEAIRAGWALRRQRQLDRMDAVPLEPFRELYVRLRDDGEVRPSDICRRMELTRSKSGRETPDYSRLGRLLGLLPPSRDLRMVGMPQLPTTLSYDYAWRLCEALNVDPVDMGL